MGSEVLYPHNKSNTNMEIYYVLPHFSPLWLIGRQHWRKSTWLDRHFGWHQMGIFMFLCFWSQEHFLFSLNIFAGLSLSLFNKCLATRYHLLSQVPTIHLDWNICTYSTSTSQIAHSRQVLMFPNIICYLYICRQKVQQIHWRSVRFFVGLLIRM